MPGIACPFPKDALVEKSPEKAVAPEKARSEKEPASFDCSEPESAKNRYRGNEGTSSPLASAAAVSGGEGVSAGSSVTSPRPTVASGEENPAGARARAEAPPVEGESQTSRKEQERVGVGVVSAHRGGRARKRTLPSAPASKTGEGPLPPKPPPEPSAATRPVEGETVDSGGRCV